MAGEEEVVVDDVVVDDEAVTEEAAPVEEPEFDLPQHWADADKEEFKAIADRASALAFSERRYREMDSGFQEKSRGLAADSSMVKALRETLEPYRQEIHASGVDEATVIRQLAATHGMLKQNPHGAINTLIQQYRIDPIELIKQVSAQHRIDLLDIDSADVNPVQQHYDSQITALQETVNNFINQQRGSLHTDNERMLQTFADEADSEGTKLRPHFDAVLDDMTKLIQAGIASGHQDAYDKAVALRPDLGSFVKAKSDAVKKAKRAAEGVTSKGGNSAKPSGDTIRGAIEAAIAEHGDL